MVIDVPLKLRQLHVVLAVAEAGSVSAAARRLNVSQPALSKTIADTERLLGQRLFDRAGRRMTLTAQGLAFERHARDALRSIERGIRTVSGGADADAVSVGVLPTVAGGLFPEVARAFATTSPDTVLSVMTAPHGHLLDKLRGGEIDLMVGRMPAPDEMSGLRFDFLYEDPIELVARAGHPGLSLGADIALRRYPLILPHQQSIIRGSVDGFLRARGFDGVQARMETVSLSVALPLILETDMLWFISRGVVAREIASRRLAGLDLGAGFMSGAVGITLRSEASLDDGAQALIDLLHGQAATSPPVTKAPTA